MRNTGSPSGDRGMDRLAARERQAGLTGMAERLVVPMKPGNSGGGKGLQLKADARSDDRTRRLAISLTTPELFSEVADGVTCNRFGDCVSLLREPEAGNPHIRFDEREQEPESCQTGLRRRSESYANCHRETTATAPVLDSANMDSSFRARHKSGARVARIVFGVNDLSSEPK